MSTTAEQYRILLGGQVADAASGQGHVHLLHGGVLAAPARPDQDRLAEAQADGLGERVPESVEARLAAAVHPHYAAVRLDEVGADIRVRPGTEPALQAGGEARANEARERDDLGARQLPEPRLERATRADAAGRLDGHLVEGEVPAGDAEYDPVRRGRCGRRTAGADSPEQRRQDDDPAHARRVAPLEMRRRTRARVRLSPQ